MTTVILRRSAPDSALPEEAHRLVDGMSASILHQDDRTMLVRLGDGTQVAELQGKLPGWVVSVQGPKIQVPDTRLKVKVSR